jgi:kynurenine formamidase
MELTPIFLQAMNNKRTFLDLTHKLDEFACVYPGTPPPSFKSIATIPNDGFEENMVSLSTHMGTHIDSPAHILSEGRNIHEFPIDHFTGKAICIPGLGNPIISKDVLLEFNLAAQKIDFVIFKSGWFKKWGQNEYLQDYPVLEKAAIELLNKIPLKGIGIDCISVDHLTSSDLPNHHLLFKRDLIIIENLTNLDQLPDHPFDLYAFPAFLKPGDAAPARVVASWPQKTA